MKENKKPKVAVVQIGSCEGCALQLVNLEEAIIDLLGVIDLVYCREVMTDNSAKFPEIDFDIALIEGSVLTKQEEEEIKKVREKAKLVVAFGACAHIGGVNCSANAMDLEEKKRIVYGKDKDLVEGLKENIVPRPISAVIKVDAVIPGCPVDPKEIASVVKDLLLGKKPVLPNSPVCVDCVMKENGCLYELGITCLGPITRRGCGARCPSNGKECLGCRGFIDDYNKNAALDVFKKYGLTVEDIKKKLGMFNNYKESEKKEEVR